MNIVALICARGGSKGLPGKNIRPLAGMPLIAWSIRQAQAVPRISRVIVSTDSEEIAAVARKAGAEVPFMRPVELAQDNSPERSVWRHALEYLKANEGAYPDVLLVVPATAPLRLPEDLERCLDEFAQGDVDTVITVAEPHRNPYFNMVKARADGGVELVIPPGDGILTRRQDAPDVYDMTTVAYVTAPDFVMRADTIFAGRVRAVRIPVERAVDIDTLMDFRVAECLLQYRDEREA
ncbi:acylneuraminate cytidylyltransferase [Methylobacillus sp. MM3]|uniref:acylneuraminate cytidylyltransferase family protein n=1 Tax=Methylobacillus sp. MM3 TaxID=1848039 RepID=UPI0007E1F8EF|nr:acylneuraminate cytidylyltransferase family protein [Methylobacillus sp. MM3]OAJ71043.1 acylneuraminate cytidylyltransferase [Methylobacillus sp. MM3]